MMLIPSFSAGSDRPPLKKYNIFESFCHRDTERKDLKIEVCLIWNGCVCGSRLSENITKDIISFLHKQLLELYRLMDMANVTPPVSYNNYKCQAAAVK